MKEGDIVAYCTEPWRYGMWEGGLDWTSSCGREDWTEPVQNTILWWFAVNTALPICAPWNRNFLDQLSHYMVNFSRKKYVFWSRPNLIKSNQVFNYAYIGLGYYRMSQRYSQQTKLATQKIDHVTLQHPLGLELTITCWILGSYCCEYDEGVLLGCKAA
jgi:hypothetical protein